MSMAHRSPRACVGRRLRGCAALRPAPAPRRPPPAPLQAGFQDGFFVQTANGDYRLLFGFVAQTDGRFVVGDPDHTVIDTFTLRKFRPTWTGRIARYFDFKLMPDFGQRHGDRAGCLLRHPLLAEVPRSHGQGQDARGYWSCCRAMRICCFRSARWRPAWCRIAMSGVQVQGDVLGNHLFYAAGVINGVPDGIHFDDRARHQQRKRPRRPRRAARHGERPKTPLPKLNGLGFAARRIDRPSAWARCPRSGRRCSRRIFPIRAPPPTARADACPRRSSTTTSRFGGFGEYMRSSQWVSKSAVRRYISNNAWEMTGSLVLTGEVASDRGVRPRNNFDPGGRPLGSAADSWDASRN